MKNWLIILCSSFLVPCSLFAQQNVEVYPSNWWVGMKWNKVQIMVHYPGIGAEKGFLTPKYPGVHVGEIKKVENKNYLFLALFWFCIFSK